MLSNRKEYNRDYREKHIDEERERNRKWYLEHKYRKNQKDKIRRMNIRKKAIQIVSKNNIPYCVGCGCDDIRLLEINHINGGGYKERVRKGAKLLYCNIISGERKIDDLDIRCKPCNSIHYLELKCGEKLPFNITWTKDRYSPNIS